LEGEGGGNAPLAACALARNKVKRRSFGQLEAGLKYRPGFWLTGPCRGGGKGLDLADDLAAGGAGFDICHRKHSTVKRRVKIRSG